MGLECLKNYDSCTVSKIRVEKVEEYLLILYISRNLIVDVIHDKSLKHILWTIPYSISKPVFKRFNNNAIYFIF